MSSLMRAIIPSSIIPTTSLTSSLTTDLFIILTPNLTIIPSNCSILPTCSSTVTTAIRPLGRRGRASPRCTASTGAL